LTFYDGGGLLAEDRSLDLDVLSIVFDLDNGLFSLIFLVNDLPSKLVLSRDLAGGFLVDNEYRSLDYEAWPVSKDLSVILS